MATTTATRTLALHRDWFATDSSDTYESLLIEVEDRLMDAPNVDEFWAIADSHLENVTGFAVTFKDGSKDFFLAFLDPELDFDADGNLTAIRS